MIVAGASCTGVLTADEPAPPALELDDGAALFLADRIDDFHLEISPESWAAIDAGAWPTNEECVPVVRPYHPATLRFAEWTFPGVGVHIKGGCGSVRGLDGKAGLKIHLEWDDPAVPGCPTKRRLHGQQHITLNNMVQDGTFLHERVGYDFYRAMGVPVPRMAYARVHVNGEYFGLYAHVESFDRPFLARHFASKQGMLYEGTYWCDLVPESVPGSIDEPSCFDPEFRADACDDDDPDADPKDFTLLRQLANHLAALPDGGFYPEVEAFFDFDTFLSSWAADSVLLHWDGYQFHIMNNYRVYHDPATDRFTLLPSGIDQTFTYDVVENWDFAEDNPWGVDGVLARRCLEEADCRDAFAARLADAVEVFAASDLGVTAASAQAQILADVRADPRKEIGDEEQAWQAERMVDWIAGRPDRVRTMLAP
jgi:hypothetical protein